MLSYKRSKEEDQQLALEWYHQTIRQQVEPEHWGELVAIDVDTGNYELGANLDDVLDKMKARSPHVLPFVLRVGNLVVDTFGGGSLEAAV